MLQREAITKEYPEGDEKRMNLVFLRLRLSPPNGRLSGVCVCL